MAADGKYPETDPERDEGRGEDETSKAPTWADSADAAAGGAAGRDRPAQTEPPFSIAFDEGAALEDRDDDSSDDDALPASFVDFDYPEDFPGVPDAGDKDDPDPGFAAFPDELDDPLADWPAPDADLDSLPEMRERAASGEDGTKPAPTDDPFGDFSLAELAEDAVDGEGPGSRQGTPDNAAPGWLDDDLPEAAFFDDPVEPDSLADFFNTTPRESGDGAVGVDRGDPAPVAESDSQPTYDTMFEDMSESSVEADNVAQDLTPVPEAPLPTVAEMPDPANIQAVDEDAYGDIDDLPSVPDTAGGPAGAIDTSRLADDADDDAFIDDFLNDLDEPDEADPGEDRAAYGRDVVAASVDEAYDSAASLHGGDSRSSGSAAVAQYGADILDAGDDQADTPAIGGDIGDGGGERVTAGTDDKDPGLPWGMIAVVGVALLLLAAGGFGVVQQRSSLKAEIRDLQAQLATAVAPEEAAAERERQRRIELENESLAAELTALEAENGALTEQLISLEARLEEQLAAQENAAREAEAAAAAAVQRAAQRPEPANAGSTAAPAADNSGWFVNFGSYAQQNIARRWADRLDVSTGRVIVQEARASGRTLYRVRVVGLPTQDAAERVATTLERQHQLPRLWVGRN